MTSRWIGNVSRIVDPIFKRKEEIRKCTCNRAKNLLERGMMVVERVLEKGVVMVNEKQFDLV